MIREVGVSLVAVAGFGLVLWWSRIAAATNKAVTLSTAGLAAMLDGDLDDRAKELAVRRAGLGLIATSFSVLWRLCVAVAVAAVPILAADWLGLVARDAVLEMMLRWDSIVIVSIVAMLLAAMVRRWRPPAADAGDTTSRYSTADRFFHALAFASPGVLEAASRLEDRVLSTSAAEPSAPPIFVTSLARAGTTPVLNALHDIPGIATHTYRDMPFLTAPTLWNRLAGGGRRRVQRRERAHGDGLEIDLDSPEAFEEVIWKMFWPEKFGANSIATWQVDDRRDEAEQFLQRHMGKVVHARRVQGPDAVYTRYCSKNNANIARLGHLMRVFADCRIVVPVRRPECHAASLLRQHVNFSTLHDEDDFIRRYMRDIGHFEFGPIHKPIWFRGFDPDRHDPSTPDYWLDYWIHAFREVLEHDAHCVLVTQDDLRSSPRATMSSLCHALDLEQPPPEPRSYFRSSPDEAPTDVYDPALYAEAAAIYGELEARAVQPSAPADQPHDHGHHVD